MPKIANPKTLGNGVSFLSRGQRFHKKGLFNKTIRAKQPAAAPAVAAKTKTVGGAKNGGSRVIKAKPSRFLLTPAERKAVSVSATKAAPKPVKLRATITPGTVLILVAGRFRSKRVVFLKQLPSGLLLVSGPYKVNGVPLRRVDQRYVIATSTKVDVSGVKIPEYVNDAFFKKAAEKAPKKSEEQFFAKDEKKARVLSADRLKAQKEVDAALLQAISKVATLSKYLAHRFTLSNKVFPHELTF
eukprot:TRINITY_DN36_c0_g1_i6.p1 TRINITY_DN36_c0_g1~~TRINITY_DN36_c0_g1_i6.p1  ORF type:complete len:271 (+),score=210.08 TRINITY_DN36_c0_g1_i6:86-814(+)